MPQVKIKVPSGLEVSAESTVSFCPVIQGDAYSGQIRTCRLDGLPPRSDSVRECAFDPSGRATLGIPAHHSGEVTVSVIFEDRNHLSKLFGSFGMTVSRFDSRTPILLDESRAAPGAPGANSTWYNPVTIRISDTVHVEKVGDQQVVTLDLIDIRDDLPKRKLADLRRGALLQLPTPDGRVRFLQVHVGPTCVLGRVYTDQLRPEARERLRQESHRTTVNWVTCWDDNKVKQLSALLQHSSTKEGCRLTVKNIADYSRHHPSLDISVNCDPMVPILPGDCREVEPEHGTQVELRTGTGVAVRKLVEFVFEEKEHGGSDRDNRTYVPLYRTRNSVFHVPSSVGSPVEVRFLGLWFPEEEKVLRDSLAKVGQPLPVYFDLEDVRLFFEYNCEERCIMVSSTVHFDLC